MAFLTPLKSLVKTQYIFLEKTHFCESYKLRVYWLQNLFFLHFCIEKVKLAWRIVKKDISYLLMIRYISCGLLMIHFESCINMNIIQLGWHRVAWGHATFSVWGRWWALDLSYFYHHFTLSIMPFSYPYSFINPFLCSYPGFYAQLIFPLHVLVFHLIFD